MYVVAEKIYERLLVEKLCTNTREIGINFFKFLSPKLSPMTSSPWKWEKPSSSQNESERKELEGRELEQGQRPSRGEMHGYVYSGSRYIFIDWCSTAVKMYASLIAQVLCAVILKLSSTVSEQRKLMALAVCIFINSGSYFIIILPDPTGYGQPFCSLNGIVFHSFRYR